MLLTKLKLLTLIPLVLYSTFIWAQKDETLPKGISDSEKELISRFQFKSITSVLSAPPSSPVRAAAEWEEVEYLVIRWTSSFENIQRQIVAAAVNECHVIIATQSQSTVASYLISNGISLDNISFINVASDSIWIRDYAGNTVYTNDVGELALVDWIYNRPRPNDDDMPTAHANMLGLPIYLTDSGTNDLVNTGGNYMSDGLGNAFASELILEENQAGNPYGVTTKTEMDIDNIMYDYMGIENFIKMPTLPYDGIHHIDMHMKLLDEETILVSEYPTGVADGPQIEANIQYVQNNFVSAFGTPYKIERIDAPPSTSGSYPDTGGYYRTFTNSLILNKTVLVPTYRATVDAPALAIYQNLMPGYNIIGIDVDNTGENLISLSGAIHCITHTVGVAEPLLIVHQPLETVNSGSIITIDAMLKHNSGISNAKVMWREVGTSTFNEIPMSLVSGDDWSVDLPLIASSYNIDYYIWAEAISGKQLTRPITAPQGFWTTNVSTLSDLEWANQNISKPFPNPTRKSVSFDIENIYSEVNISIYNTLGQKLYNNVIETGDGIVTIDLNEEWNGILYVVFEGEFGKINRKIIKI